MGPPDGTRHFDWEGEQHEVELSKGYWLGETPVTQALWVALMGDNPSHFAEGEKAPQRPVEQVSWEDAVGFCARLSASLPGAGAFSLPTEAQWERACRGGKGARPPWSRPDSVEALEQVAWFRRNSGDATQPVGRKDANPYGLFDMLGNVWEWCADAWKDHYRGLPSVDPCRSGGDRTRRVSRGGSYAVSARRCRAAFRGKLSPDGRWWYLGFRVARGPAHSAGGARLAGSPRSDRKRASPATAPGGRRAEPPELGPEGGGERAPTAMVLTDLRRPARQALVDDWARREGGLLDLVALDRIDRSRGTRWWRAGLAATANAHRRVLLWAPRFEELWRADGLAEGGVQALVGHWLQAARVGAPLTVACLPEDDTPAHREVFRRHSVDAVAATPGGWSGLGRRWFLFPVVAEANNQPPGSMAWLEASLVLLRHTPPEPGASAPCEWAPTRAAMGEGARRALEALAFDTGWHWELYRETYDADATQLNEHAVAQLLGATDALDRRHRAVALLLGSDVGRPLEQALVQRLETGPRDAAWTKLRAVLAVQAEQSGRPSLVEVLRGLSRD